MHKLCFIWRPFGILLLMQKLYWFWTWIAMDLTSKKHCLQILKASGSLKHRITETLFTHFIFRGRCGMWCKQSVCPFQTTSCIFPSWALFYISPISQKRKVKSEKYAHECDEDGEMFFSILLKGGEEAMGIVVWILTSQSVVISTFLSSELFS